MYKKSVTLFDLERKSGQKTGLLGIDARSGPLDNHPCIVMHALVRFSDHGIVMVSDHNDGAFFMKLHDCCQRPFRVGAIPDQITDKSILLHTLKLRVAHARLNGFAIGVYIRK